MTSSSSLLRTASLFGSFCLLLICLGLPQVSRAQSTTNEYVQLTRERVEAALKPDATKNDLSLAEGSLTALGYYVLFGNGAHAFEQVKQLNEVPVALYNGTDKMSLIYMGFTSNAYAEMLNLDRFEDQSPLSPSTELSEYATSQVEKAIQGGASNGDQALIEAEGSLMGLGWLTAYGNT